MQRPPGGSSPHLRCALRPRDYFAATSSRVLVPPPPRQPPSPPPPCNQPPVVLSAPESVAALLVHAFCFLDSTCKCDHVEFLSQPDLFPLARSPLGAPTSLQTARVRSPLPPGSPASCVGTTSTRPAACEGGPAPQPLQRRGPGLLREPPTCFPEGGWAEGLL